jgi:hypothetical protein
VVDPAAEQVDNIKVNQYMSREFGPLIVQVLDRASACMQVLDRASA